ncbi:MAG: GIY-YIG nuclease family protein [Chthoniobacteraceae bacterium]
MLYFISSTIGIKIGISSSPLSRLATINTSSHHPCRLVLALEVPNEKQVESRLHELLGQYRLNGEWFDVSFHNAFRALNDLNVISDPFPKLDLQYVPDMDKDFPYWWMAVNSLEEAYKEDVERAWRDCREEFVECRKQGLSFDEMVARGRAKQKQIEANFATLRKKLHTDQL